VKRDGLFGNLLTGTAPRSAALYAVVDGPVRAMVLSGTIAKSEKDLRERITGAVGLLLDGCRAPAARRG
jgi:hypothetical protein